MLMPIRTKAIMLVFRHANSCKKIGMVGVYGQQKKKTKKSQRYDDRLVIKALISYQIIILT
jgi:hypothetical protein